jgi:mono/diheme cytochrome c family protein
VRSLWSAVAAVAAVLPAAVAAPPTHRAEGDAAIAARRVFLKHCADCHGDADAKKRKGRFWVTDWTSMIGIGQDAPPVPFVSKDSSQRSQVLEFLKDGSMPPGGRPRPSPTEVKAVEDWLKTADGAKPFPPKFDTDAVLDLILNDPGRNAQNARNVRYVSFAHLVDQPGADLGKAEADLAKALSLLLPSTAKSKADVYDSAFKPVKGSAGTVFRLDLEAFGWHQGEKNLFEVSLRGQASWTDEEFRMIPFDLIQLEYPYTHPAKEKKGEVAKLLADLNAHRKGEKDPLAQLRAVPFVSGDWLAAALLMQEGKLTPLARDLEALAKLGDALEAAGDKRRVGTGPTFAPFKDGPPVTDATAPSPWAWYQRDVLSTDKGFTVTTETDLPVGNKLKPDGKFKLTGTSSRAAALSLIEVQHDRVEVLKLTGRYSELEADKPGTVSTTEDDQGKMRPGKVNKGGFHYVLLATPKPSPARPHRDPVVVKSRHESSSVWRILPHPADAADPPPVVREVIDLDIKTSD